MVHGVRLRDGRAEWYRNRFVRDSTVTEVKHWPRTPGPRHGMGSGTANTNVIGLDGRTYAIVEAGGLPVELTYDLDTVQMSDFDGTLPGSFTAHPKRDPATGENHAVVYYWEWDYVQYVVVGTDGPRAQNPVDIPVPGKPMVHDYDHRVTVSSHGSSRSRSTSTPRWREPGPSPIRGTPITAHGSACCHTAQRRVAMPHAGARSISATCTTR